jgi:hypothetical protein
MDLVDLALAAGILPGVVAAGDSKRRRQVTSAVAEGTLEAAVTRAAATPGVADTSVVATRAAGTVIITEINAKPTKTAEPVDRHK